MYQYSVNPIRNGLTKGLNKEREHLGILDKVPELKAVRRGQCVDLLATSGSSESWVTVVLPHVCATSEL